MVLFQVEVDQVTKVQIGQIQILLGVVVVQKDSCNCGNIL